MGVRESVGELEAAMSELNEEKAEPKAKKARETVVREDRLGGMEVRIGDTESGIAELRENVGALQEKLSSLEAARENSGAGGYATVESRIKELEGRDYSADIAKLGKAVSEIRSGIASAGGGGEQAGAPAKALLELKSRMDALQKYVEGKISSMDRMVEDAARNSAGSQKDIMPDIDRRINERLKALMQSADFQKPGAAAIDRLNEFSKRLDSVKNNASRAVSEALKNIPKADDMRRSIDERINARISEFSKKVEELSRCDLGKLKNVADAEKALGEKLKLFALNSDVEKVWKDMEGLRKYIDEKSKYADGLANSLQAWESRRLELAAKERDFEEKITAFPELKLLDSRIRKAERAILELQRHFVAAKIAEPIIME